MSESEFVQDHLKASPFDCHIGMTILDAGPDLVRADVPVRAELLQPTGVVHGGVYATIAEATASLGANHASSSAGKFALGMSNATNFLRPVSRGTIHAEARPRHSGASTAVWDVEISDDEGRLCATGRVTLALRPMPDR